MRCVVVLKRIDDLKFSNQNAKSQTEISSSNDFGSRNLNPSSMDCDSESMQYNLDRDGSSEAQVDTENTNPSFPVVPSNSDQVPIECFNFKKEAEDDQEDFEILLEATANTSFTEVNMCLIYAYYSSGIRSYKTSMNLHKHIIVSDKR